MHPHPAREQVAHGDATSFALGVDTLLLRAVVPCTDKLLIRMRSRTSPRAGPLIVFRRPILRPSTRRLSTLPFEHRRTHGSHGTVSPLRCDPSQSSDHGFTCERYRFATAMRRAPRSFREVVVSGTICVTGGMSMWCDAFGICSVRVPFDILSMGMSVWCVAFRLFSVCVPYDISSTRRVALDVSSLFGAPRGRRGRSADQRSPQKVNQGASASSSLSQWRRAHVERGEKNWIEGARSEGKRIPRRAAMLHFGASQHHSVAASAIACFLPDQLFTIAVREDLFVGKRRAAMRREWHRRDSGDESCCVDAARANGWRSIAIER